ASRSENAVCAAINARFSLFAVGTLSSGIFIYKARDHTAKAPLSHTLASPSSNTGQITALAWSPDGYILLVGYERGWALYSVFGRLGAHSFTAEAKYTAKNPGDAYLTGVLSASWLSSGQELLILTPSSSQFYVLEMARSAITTCFTPANLARAMLITSE